MAKKKENPFAKMKEKVDKKAAAKPAFGKKAAGGKMPFGKDPKKVPKKK